MTGLWLRLNRALWSRLPASLRNTRPLRWYGGVIHRIVSARAERRQYFGTFFLRNRPELEQLVHLIRARPEASALKVAVLGCSTGCEVYSVLWSIRTARPDLDVRTQALDIAPQIVEAARRAVYTSESSELVGSSIFERLNEQERVGMFDWDGDRATVKPWIQQGIQWQIGDASDPALIRTLGPQDIVLASNFLCHMNSADAEACLRNIAQLVAPGGHIFVLGVDLDIRERVARELGWQPIPDLIREIHDGDPSVRNDWPWDWWGLEPLDDRRKDWQWRYAVGYRVETGSVT